jgi:hypothetical protein
MAVVVAFLAALAAHRGINSLYLPEENSGIAQIALQAFRALPE